MITQMPPTRVQRATVLATDWEERHMRWLDKKHAAECFTGVEYDTVAKQYQAWRRGQIVGWHDHSVGAWALIREG